MEDSSSTSRGDTKPQNLDSSADKVKQKKAKKASAGSKTENKEVTQEVLLKLPGGFEYKMPGKRQRIIVASTVVGLNMLLLIAVGLYFYIPAFKDWIFNFGK